jgi:hypothetical protein
MYENYKIGGKPDIWGWNLSIFLSAEQKDPFNKRPRGHIAHLSHIG